MNPGLEHTWDVTNKNLHVHLGLHLPLVLNPSIQRDLLSHMSRTQLPTSVGPSDKAIEVLNKNNFVAFADKQDRTATELPKHQYKRIQRNHFIYPQYNYHDGRTCITQNYSKQFKRNYFYVSAKLSYRNLNTILLQTAAL